MRLPRFFYKQRTSPMLGSFSGPRVVVVGGGFGGLTAAKALGGARARVTLIDRRNHHLFQPLLYQVATAVLSPADIAQPIRAVMRDRSNVEVALGEVQSVDVEAKEVVLADSRIPYDYLVLAAGANHFYFGHDEWEPNAPGLKSLEEALDIRRRLLVSFEEAERETDPERRKALMTFVVVGGGPTGVEMAGAIAEIARYSLAKDFRHIDTRDARVILLEAADRLLLAFPAQLSRHALWDLQRLGVDVRFNTPVTNIESGSVTAGDQVIQAETIIWAAGVKSSPIGATLGVETDRAGRVIVQPDLTIPGHPEIFVIGDMSSLTGPNGRPYPGVAQVAKQQGQWAAKNIRRAMAGQPMEPFQYIDLGNMATIGRNAAVADIRGVTLTGFFAWLVWALVHVFNLIGFRNRVVVGVQWLWGYLSFQRGARLITGSTKE
ncbi:MAG: NAD(P)/FAD-dependent oxidoreductase [Thermomicrobiales bacterium]